MFSQLFGNYLVQTGSITTAQLEKIEAVQNTTRVKLGLIAVAENMMSQGQADEINRMQAVQDRRFGDIAVDKGYLTDCQVSELLKKQGNPYLFFLQVLTEEEGFTAGQVDELIYSFQKAGAYSDEELAALKSGDINQIFPFFVHTDNERVNNLASLAVRTLVRFIDNHIVLGTASVISEYPFDNMANQQLIGHFGYFFGFSSGNTGLLSIASPFAREKFDTVDEDSLDAVCEFINCINGLYASALSETGIELDLLPPVTYRCQTLSAKGSIYQIPLTIHGRHVDMLIVMDELVDVR